MENIKLPCRAEHIIAGNYGNGLCTYAKIGQNWYSVNADCNTLFVYDIRWRVNEHELKQILNLIAFHPKAGIQKEIKPNDPGYEHTDIARLARQTIAEQVDPFPDMTSAIDKHGWRNS